MRIGSLCTGYGGLDMGLQSVIGGTLAWYSEIEPAACVVLAAHHPGVSNIGDLTAADWSRVQPIHVLTAGYPCQPFSHAGKRKGADDERHLWPDIAAAIGALRPRLVFMENVRGHLSMGLADVVGDLAALRYDVRWVLVRASDAEAAHGRARVFIAAVPWGERFDWFGDVAGASSTRRGRASTSGSSEPSADDHGAGRREQRRTVAVRTEHGAVERAGDDSAAYADRGRHGGQQDADRVDRVDRADAGAARQRERSRAIADAGDVGHAADTEGRRRGTGTRPTAPQAGHARQGACDGGGVDWGKYGPAIRRWAGVLGRPAPCPTVLNDDGKPFLSPYFDEWFMGLPEGHVTGHGLTRPQVIKLCGNGVVPQQAALAARLLGIAPMVAAA